MAYQQLHKHDGIPGWLEDQTGVSQDYLQAQCATGRAGPLCSSCARGYGMGPGSVCRKCPSTGRAGALIVYLVVRLLDVLLVALLACVLLLVWSRAKESFSGSGLQSHSSYESVNSTTALQAAVTSGDSADPVGDAQKQQPGSSEMDERVLTNTGRLAVWVMVSVLHGGLSVFAE